MTSNLGYDARVVSNIVARFDRRPEMLVQILHAMLVELRYIPEAALPQLADELNLSRADIHGVVSFYHDFRRSPPGRHVVKICQAEACQARGARELTRHAEQSLGVRLSGTAGDITLEPVYCLGNCALTPSVMIDGRTYGRVSNERFDTLVAALDGSAP